MRTFHTAMVLLGSSLLVFEGAPVHAQSATQAVTFGVLPARQASVTAPASPLRIPRGGGRFGERSAVVRLASYALSTNEANQKVTVGLDSDMPKGVAVSILLAAPHGAVSTGVAGLTAQPADLVTGIPARSSGTYPAEFMVNASAEHGIDAVGSTRIVTFTILAGQ